VSIRWRSGAGAVGRFLVRLRLNFAAGPTLLPGEAVDALGAACC
jgi:hypothetical protein